MARTVIRLLPRDASIRTRSIPNVPNGRLLMRLAWLRDNLRYEYRNHEQKSDVKARAREAVNIERELKRRGIRFTPVTDGRHLDIDVWRVREIRPMEKRGIRTADGWVRSPADS